MLTSAPLLSVRLPLGKPGEAKSKIHHYVFFKKQVCLPGEVCVLLKTGVGVPGVKAGVWFSKWPETKKGTPAGRRQLPSLCYGAEKGTLLKDGWAPTAGQLEASGGKCGVQLREGVVLFLGLSFLYVAQSLIWHCESDDLRVTVPLRFSFSFFLIYIFTSNLGKVT